MFSLSRKLTASTAIYCFTFARRRAKSTARQGGLDRRTLADIGIDHPNAILSAVHDLDVDSLRRPPFV